MSQVYWSSLRRIGALSLVTMVATLAAFSWNQAEGGRSVAWCYDGHRWLPFSEGIPGSVSREGLVSCLESSADQEYVYRFDAQIIPGGALIDLGDTSLFWAFKPTGDTKVEVTAHDDRVIFGDTCDRRIEVSAGVTAVTAPGYPCIGRERISVDPRTVSEVDFTIYVTRRQFIVDAAEGWYHIHIDSTGASGDPTPRAWLQLRSSGRGVWVSAEREIVQGMHHFIHEPLAATIGDRQQYRAYDWEIRVDQELIPMAFKHSAHFLLPDWDAYWAEVRGWLAAIVDDLYRDRVEPVELHVLDTVSWEAYAAGRTIYTSYASANTILHELGHVLAGTEAGHNEDFTAMVLMLWDRYIPGFNTARAMELAARYSVQVGSAPAVEPVSGRTTIVRDLFAKTAPELPSDYEPIDPEELHFRVELEVGREYTFASGKIVTSSRITPVCQVTEPYSDGTASQAWHPPHGEFTISSGGTWNGIEIVGFSNGEHGSVISGTPTTAGRVRVEVTTKCPGGSSQEPRLVGYSEVIVVDPNDDE